MRPTEPDGPPPPGLRRKVVGPASTPAGTTKGSEPGYFGGPLLQDMDLVEVVSRSAFLCMGNRPGRLALRVLLQGRQEA